MGIGAGEELAGVVAVIELDINARQKGRQENEGQDDLGEKWAQIGKAATGIVKKS